MRNKVTESGIIPIHLLQFKPKIDILEIDIKDYLFMDYVLKEREFRLAMEDIDWQKYQSKAVYIHCSNEAIIPQWCPMLIASKLSKFAYITRYGTKELIQQTIWMENMDRFDVKTLDNKKVTLIADPEIPDAMYTYFTTLITKNTKAIMYGEPGLPKVIYKKRTEFKDHESIID